MLNGVSCWYIDWATIGTWVGGVGAAAAAWTAVWAVKSGVRQRENFAKFLFNNDLKRLEGMHSLVKGVPNYLSQFDHELEAQQREARRYIEEVLIKSR